MAARAELSGKVKLNTTAFSRSIRGMRRQVRQFGRTFGAPFARAARSMARIGIIAGTIVAAGLGLAIKKVTDMGDQMDKMSARTGIGTEALSELKFAADLSGGSIEDLEKAIKTMQKRILDAERGLSTATDAFDILGVAMEEIKGKTPEQQMDVFLDALAGVDDASRRAALAQEVFGRAGTRLLPMLTDGTKGLKEMRAQARLLGVVVSPEQAKEAARFKDEITRVQAAVLGLGLAGIRVTRLSDVLNAAAAAIVQFRRSGKFEVFVRAFKAMVGTVIDFGRRLVNTWSTISDDTKNWVKNMVVIFGTLTLAMKFGLVAPILKLLVAMVSGIAVNLVLMITNFAAFQIKMAAFATNMKIIVTRILQAFIALATIILAFAAGRVLGKAMEEAFNLSGGILRAGAITQAALTDFKARLTLSGEELEIEAQRISDVLQARFKEIAAAEIPKGERLGFTEALKASADEVGKEMKAIADSAFGVLGDAGGKITDILDAWKAKLGVMPKLDDALGVGDAGDELVRFGGALKDITAPVRGFFVEMEKLLRAQPGGGLKLPQAREAQIVRPFRVADTVRERERERRSLAGQLQAAAGADFGTGPTANKLLDKLLIELKKQVEIQRQIARSEIRTQWG